MAGPDLDPFGFEFNIFVWPQSLPMEKPINSKVLAPIPKRVLNKNPHVPIHTSSIP
jgi:hypothetical protein